MKRSLYKRKSAFIETTASVDIDNSVGEHSLGAGTQVCGTTSIRGSIKTYGLIELKNTKIDGNVYISGDKTGTLISGAKIEGNVDISLLREMIGDFWIHSDPNSSTTLTSGYINTYPVLQNLYSSFYGSGEIYNSTFWGAGESHVNGFKVVNSTVSLKFSSPLLSGAPQVINSTVYRSDLGGNASIINSSFSGGAIDNARVINSPNTGGFLSGYATLENMHELIGTALTGSSYVNNVKFYADPPSKTLTYSNGFCGNLLVDSEGHSAIDIYSGGPGIPGHYGCKSHLSK